MSAIPSTAESIAKSVRIPPRPEALVLFRQEMANANPNFNKLAAAVSSDVSLSGAVLQIINSPAFGARSKVTSINHACNMLGLVRVEKVVQAVALRGALSKGVSLDRFWDSANEIANLSRILAQKLSGIPA
ncbi:MAG TPA: HDOD domain-containing protein, partial [Candidatus Kapabacteria bacterium]|nr:HDOD domain-containing protein [Candidatus Kapabacteria bacterium]